MPEAVEGDPMSDARCDSCGGPARVWFAPSALWNRVMGGPDAKGDPGGMLCPNCFVDRAETIWAKPTAWKIAPETDEDTENAKIISDLRAALSRAEAEREEAVKALEPFVVGAEMFYANDPDERTVSLGRWSDDADLPRFYADTALTVAHIRAGYAVSSRLSRAVHNEETKP